MKKRARKSANNSRTSRKVWTVICLVLVWAVAIAVRSDAIYRIYPLDYQESIDAYGTEYGIDPYFISAVIYAESGFDEQAVSQKGAVGLMQIMPETGEWAAQKVGIEDYTEAMLGTADTNIQIGCWYLGYLNDLFEGDARKILAAYNAGPANVQEWTEDDGSLESIPYEETENYLEKVQRYYEIYKRLYNDF